MDRYSEPDRKCVPWNAGQIQGPGSMFQETGGQISGNQKAGSRDQKILGTMQFKRPGGKIPGTMYKGTKDSRKMGVPGTGGTDLRNQKA
jgi:hypothetical protein